MVNRELSAGWRRDKQARGLAGTQAGQARQLVWVSFCTSGSLPSSRTRAAVVRPSAHSVSSAGWPVIADQLDPDRRLAEDEAGGPEPLPQRVGHARTDLA